MSASTDTLNPGLTVAQDTRPESVPLPQRASRRSNLDRVRMLAFVDIIAFHLPGNQHLLGGIGLPALLMVSCALTARTILPKTTQTYLAERVRRVAVPWIFWCVLYGVYFMTLAFRREEPILGWANWRMPLYGTYIHLWFLPFMMVAGLIVHKLHWATWQRTTTRIAAVSLGLGLVLLVVVDGVEHQWQAPFKQWWFAIPAIPLGFAIGRALCLPDTWRHRGVWAAIAIVTCLLAVALFNLTEATITARYMASLSIITLAMALPDRADRVTRAIMPLLLGVYLVHPMVIFRTYGLFASRDQFWLWLFAVLALSLATVALMRRTPLRRFV